MPAAGGNVRWKRVWIAAGGHWVVDCVADGRLWTRGRTVDSPLCPVVGGQWTVQLHCVLWTNGVCLTACVYSGPTHVTVTVTVGSTLP